MENIVLDDEEFDALIDRCLSRDVSIQDFRMYDTYVGITYLDDDTGRTEVLYADYRDFVAHFAIVNLCSEAVIKRG